MRTKTTRPFIGRVTDQFWLLVNTGISAKEYYMQELWNSNLVAIKKHEYLGEFGSYKWQTAVNPEGYTALLDDKLLFDTILRNAGIATGTTLAIYSKTAPSNNYPVLRDVASLEKWLIENGEDIFIKPLCGINGTGTLSIGKRLSSVQPSWEQLPLKQSISLDAILKHICSWRNGEFIIQRRLIPSIETAKFSTNVFQTLRIMTLQRDQGVELVAAALKIGSGRSAVDNLLHGKNMIAAVNLDNGKLGAAVEVVDGEPIWHSKHPISGMPIEGAQLENINDIKVLVTRVAECLPWFKTVGWDVGLTAEGPLILEGNYYADVLLIQIAHQKGILSWPQYRAFFNEYNLYQQIGMGFMKPLLK
nr:sugar-transfer associated ATP-grasp domain-containing protein [Nitrosomonas nitrosa]